MVNARVGFVAKETPATSIASASLISKLSIAISPNHCVPLPSSPTVALILNLNVSEKLAKLTVSKFH